MNVAIFTNNYLPNPYGVTTSIESFRLQFEKMGHRVYVFAPHSSGFEDKNPNVFRFPSIDLKYKIKFPLPIPYSKDLESKIDELEIDVIHSQHPNLLGDVAMRWATKKKIPLVFTWHTLYDRYTNYVPLLPNDWAAKWAIGNAVEYSNKCDQVIVPTHSVKKLVQKWGVENNNIIDIPTGVDEINFAGSDGEKIRKELDISDQEVVIFSASRLAEEKNIIFLLRSVIVALKRNPRAKFVLGGEGYLEEEIREIISDNDLDDRVILPGLILRDDLKDYFDAADIFVYASKSETQGNILSEAMYMGLPSVSVDATGSRDLIFDKKNGLLVGDNRRDFSMAIERLILDKDSREFLGENARKDALEKYTDKVCAKRMIEIYDRLQEV
jgi:glycosyltransferase involved in cell wall biosynthesis